MKINPKYGDRIITIPGTQVLDYLIEATEAELKVLIFTLANQNTTLNEIADSTGLDPEAVKEALFLWKSKGVMSVTGLGRQTKKEDAEAPASSSVKSLEKPPAQVFEEPAEKKVVIVSSELPSYSTDQINRILEKNKKTKELIDNCQQVLGKIMSIHEVEVILKLVDFLGLKDDYVLMLCSHCASMKKTSLRYIEKTAVALFDEGITEYSALVKHLEYQNAANKSEGDMRRLLGIGERAFTKKEKELFLCWAKWEMPFELIERAFEITVENTSRFSIKYMNAVIESWHKSGIKTPEAASKAQEDYQKTKAPAKPKTKTKEVDHEGGSFSTTSFFEAALKRSYRESEEKLRKAENKD